jgi:predicted phage terminase large subunit-like protein
MTTRTTTTAVRPLLEFIPNLTPRFQAPTHLAALAELFERSERGAVQACVDCPPRHGKTEMEKHAIARRLLARPETRIGLASYSATFAEKKSREIRELYRRAGGRVASDAKSKADWRTGVGDGGLWAGGIEGAWTGEGFDLLVVDDPIKDRARAESGVEREKLWDWHQSVALPRIEPGGSYLVVHTRWTTDDLIARLVHDGWEHVHLQALDARGQALWPERYPAEKLQRIREQIGPYVWAGLYQGSPYSRGGQCFAGDVNFYDELPSGLRISVGCDFAYSTKAKSDYSVAVVIGEKEGRYYVIEVVRMQVRAPEFKVALEGLCARYGGVRPIAYVSGVERGTTDFMATEGWRIDARSAVSDKFTRAQPVSAAWTAGKIMLPRQANWLDPFVSEIVSFTGVRDAHDDQVDAFASAFDGVRVDYVVAAQRASFQRRSQGWANAFRRMEATTPEQIAALRAEDVQKAMERRHTSTYQEKVAAERKLALEKYNEMLGRIGSPAYVPPKKKD